MPRVKELLLAAALSGVIAARETIAGYVPGSDVEQHNRLDLDIADFEQYVADADWEKAITIYTNGKHSLKSSSIRTLKGFSNNNEKLKGEPLADLYASYWGSYSYADEMVMAALKGTGVYAGAENIAREEISHKGVQYQVVWMYVVHELEDAISDCKTSSIIDNDAGVHAWDEGWAFYTGSLEGHDGSGKGQMIYDLADKRCKNFNTCDVSGTSKINIRLLSKFQQAEDALSKGWCAEGDRLMAEIKPLMAVPLIQGALRYAYKSDPTVGPSTAKAIAEGWAFTAAILPQIDAVDSNVAKTIRRNMEYGAANPVADGYKSVFQFFQSVYAGLGISCADVGGLLDGDGNYYPGTEPCVDSHLSEAIQRLDLSESIQRLDLSKTVSKYVSVDTGLLAFSIINLLLIIGVAGAFRYKMKKGTVGFQQLPSHGPGSTAVSLQKVSVHQNGQTPSVSKASQQGDRDIVTPIINNGR